MKKSIRIVSLAIFNIVPLFTFISCSKSDKRYKTKITHVHDGDTFTDSVGRIYRLAGVDTPELSYPKTGKESHGIEHELAMDATNYAKYLIENKDVIITPIKKDKYGRIVARVNINGQDLSILEVKNGMARVAYINVVDKPNKWEKQYNTKDYNFYKQLQINQFYSFKNHLGIWKNYDKNNFRKIFPKA